MFVCVCVSEEGEGEREQDRFDGPEIISMIELVVLRLTSTH